MTCGYPFIPIISIMPFNFFTSFGYFKTRREHDAAVRTIAKSLKPAVFLLWIT
jgi:hypothetical protein